MKRRINVFICILLSVCFLATAFCVLINEFNADNNYQKRLTEHLEALNASSVYDMSHHKPEHKKAILMLPGLMDSALYSVDEKVDGKPVCYWGADSEDTSALLGTLSKLEVVAVANADGIPAKTLRAGNMTDDLKYDAFGAFRPVFEYAEERYGDEYDIICWQYDWRTHLDDAAYELNSFINGCGYEKVILIGHSMGCCVSSRYLAMGEEQRNKVELFVAYGGPMLGAIEANSLAFEAKGRVNSVMRNLMGLIESDNFSLTNATRQLTCGLHLMGLSTFNGAPYFADGETYVSVDGKYLSHDDYYDYLTQNYAWTKGSDGNVKFSIDTFDEYENDLYIDGKHVSQLVNTHYIAAVGQTTCYAYDIDSTTKKLNYIKTTDQGDMLVTLYSATVGLAKDKNNVPANVHILDGATHIDMVIVDPLVSIFDELDEKNK